MHPALERFVESQTWLDSLGEPLQHYITSLFRNGGDSGRRVKNLLNGTWLGHPLHPMITDVPVGAWTCTMVLDVASAISGNESLEDAADITLATGLAASLGAASSGWADWSDTYGKDRSTGLLHGLTMASGLVMYLTALILRRSGSRKSGVLLSDLAYGVIGAGAYVGGEEVYDLGYGINHTAFQHGPSEFVAVMAESELTDDAPKQADAQGTAVLLVKQAGQIYALDDTCVHAGCSLAGGKLQGRSIVCPCHGSQFDLASGKVINGPATMPEPKYDVRITDGMIEVKQALP